MMVALIVSALSCLIAGASHAEIFTLDSTRGIFSESVVNWDGFPALVDTFDSGSDKTLGTFDQNAATSIEVNFLNTTLSSSRQTSTYDLSPNSALALTTGFASVLTSVSDPGFPSSVSSGVGSTLFRWTFNVDQPTQYTLSAELDASLLGFDVFGAFSSGEIVVTSSFSLRDVSRNVTVHTNNVSDATDNGVPVSEISNHQGILLPGTYELSAAVAVEADVSEDAATSGGAGFLVGLNLETIPESDDDGDGVPNSSDNCPQISNLSQLNTDGDSQGNACDSDDDNDGVPDSTDAFPLDVNESEDTDGDGEGDNGDNCPMVSNADQTDLNGNGIGDACEAAASGHYLGDFNGDGGTDLLEIGASPAGAMLRLSIVSEAGAWTHFAARAAGWPERFSDIYTGDFNADGKTDLLVVDPAGGAVIKLSAGPANQWTGWTDVWAAWDTNFSIVYPGDYDGDGKTDLLTVRPAGGAVLRLSRGGAGQWTHWSGVWAAWNLAYSDVYPGDYNGDQRTDILTVRPAGGAVVRLSTGTTGSFTNWLSVWAPWNLAFSDIYLGDYNGDGKTDLLTVRPAGGAALRLAAGGTGQFAGWTARWAPWDLTYSQVYQGDYNGDERTDILTVRPAGGAVLRTSNVSGANWLGWQASWAAWDSQFSRIDVGDLSGDGVSDLLTQRSDGATVIRETQLSGGSWSNWRAVWGGVLSP